MKLLAQIFLLPFAREAVSDLVGKAGFPQLLLSPINFEGLYQQKQQQRKVESEGEGETESAAQDTPQQ